MVGSVVGGPLPVRIRAWDGSEAGPAGATVLHVRSRRALRRLLWSPGELGLAEAYVGGDLDIEGDLAQGLSTVWAAHRSGAVDAPSIGVRKVPSLIGTAVRLGALGPRPPAPGQAQLSGRRHSRTRDRAAIAHHYDLSNDFYELLLDDSMAYSCGYWTDGPDGDLADAQQAKLDLICRKLGLTPGARHLDIGCGWGSLICHAAQHFGTTSVGVTLSRQQYEYVSKRVADAGLGDRVTVVHADYRDLAEGGPLAQRYRGFDAVSTIEMGEHVGDAEYPAFTQLLHDVLRPGGRALVQQMSRSETRPGGGAFIETYIAPDMHMKPLGTTVSLINGSGLEIRDVHALREHYDWTVSAWARTLEDRWDEVVTMIGEVGARVWRLYLVGGALAFAENRMGVDQILAVRPDPTGQASMEPSRRVWES
nr:cyclopropane-fatty-acyl-phospholipid synthase family protein [Nakamurella flavida]